MIAWFIIALLIILIFLVTGYSYLIIIKLKTIMATQVQFNEALQRIDVATNNIAADLRKLKDQIEGAGLPQEVEDQVLATLEEKATKLESIAAETEDEPGDETPSDDTEGENTQTAAQRRNRSINRV
jgi:hypothetical protein